VGREGSAAKQHKDEKQPRACCHHQMRIDPMDLNSICLVAWQVVGCV
jgi:hypothetical protein